MKTDMKKKETLRKRKEMGKVEKKWEKFKLNMFLYYRSSQ